MYRGVHHHEGVLRVGVIDDHPVVGLGIVAALERLSNRIEQVGSATSWRTFQDEVLSQDLLPDLVLVDGHLNDGTRTPEVIAGLTARNIRAVLFTSDARPVLVREAIEAGACGLILKTALPEDILRTIDSLRVSPFAVCSSEAGRAVSSSREAPRLGARELETMRLLSTGKSRSGVARHIVADDGRSLTVSTINTYVNRVVAKYRAAGVPCASTVEVLGALRKEGYLVEEPH